MTKAVTADRSERFAEIIQRLSDKSIAGYYNPYREMKWPESLPLDMPWMSEDLMSTYGTGLAGELTEEEQHRLSRWESINFYSMNVHGIRELLIEQGVNDRTAEWFDETKPRMKIELEPMDSFSAVNPGEKQ